MLPKQELIDIYKMFDKYGYVIAYKATVTLAIDYEKKGSSPQKFTTTGEYDFSIVANSVISDSSRYDAIRFASNAQTSS